MADPGYQVLARKWRPQRFEDIVGQPAVVRTLVNALRGGRVAHAYCFSGIRGVGKTTAARLLAKGLNCRASEGATAEPCGRCESCQEIEASRSLDVIELDAASHTGVDDIRELNEVARYAPSRDRHRVFIIDEAHMLSNAANNALLKTLEEPPPWLVFVLATTEPSKILPTVLSRCQVYEFGRISQGELRSHLGHIAAAEGVTISPDGLALLATAADGSLRDGQSLLDKLIAFAGENIDEQTVVELLGLVDRVLVQRVVDLIAAEDVAGVLGFVNEMVDRGVDLHQFAIDLLGHFRNLLVVRSVPDPGAILHLPGDDMERLQQQAEAFEIDDLDRAFSLLAASEYRIKTADQPRYHLEVLLARLARMPRLQPIAALLQALDNAAGGSAGSSPGRGDGGTRSRPAATRRPPPPPAPTRPAPPRAEKPPLPDKPPPPDRATRAVEQTATPPPPDPPEMIAPEPAVVAPASAEPPPVEPPPVEPEPVAAAPAERAEAAVVESDGLLSGTASRILARIQQELETRNGMIASVLGRSCGLTMAGERLVVQFPSSAALFAQRLQDAKMLALLGEAAEAALGRRAIVRVEVLADARPAAAPLATATPEPRRPRPRSVPAPAEPTSTPPAASEPTAAAGNDGGMRARVEANPMVQEFVKVLKGQITSVEEL